MTTNDLAAEHKALKNTAGENLWREIIRVAQVEHGFLDILRMDREIVRAVQAMRLSNDNKVLRLAVLASATVEQLSPGIRFAGAKLGIPIQIYHHPYGQALQELANARSGLYEFAPHFILIAQASEHTFNAPLFLDTDPIGNTFGAAYERLKQLREQVQTKLGIPVIQQTLLPVFSPLVGNNEHKARGSSVELLEKFNAQLRTDAAQEGFSILGIDRAALNDGLSQWHDPALWHRNKQEVKPAATQAYGDQVARILAAYLGLSKKCLVLDLDNTLWGGVIGDDGLAGINLGQNSATGEAFVAIQKYLRDLSRRGIILAVCSKNDEKNALLPFEKHPDMILKREDIACFVANWEDKASNIRGIAKALNIGLNSLVFVDDNPFERNQVRRELPEVSVPEMPEDPAFFVRYLANQGYFETIDITEEDFSKTKQYQENAIRESFYKSASGNLEDYLRELDMQLLYSPFDEVGLPRVAQLINKTNQFNLTTRRYTQEQLELFYKDQNTITLQLRLRDRFGDNGMISVLIAQQENFETWRVNTWLMSCRVLGRGVEKAALGLLTEAIQKKGGKTLKGTYIPTDKNGMVSGHYENLGFKNIGTNSNGETDWSLHLDGFSPPESIMKIQRI